ncbi:MAG: hypothetical protein L6R42_003995, partial [Xanthoria sp. 1 TBL-2021]
RRPKSQGNGLTGHTRQVRRMGRKTHGRIAALKTLVKESDSPSLPTNGPSLSAPETIHCRESPTLG